MSRNRDLDGTSEFFEPSPERNFARIAIIACFIGIAWYNAIELIVLCFTTFKRYGGCYFWCLLISTISIIPFALGYLLAIFGIWITYFAIAVEVVGWYGMVTGQSMVLWSRLHLLVETRWIIYGTLAMIIIDAILFHIPATVIEFGVHSSHPDRFITPFEIFERIQVVGFSLQEIILSAIYAREAVRLLKLWPRGGYKGTLFQLLVINLIMIGMDAAIIGFQYAGLFRIHVTFKAMVYSIKLKMEYAILGKLVHVSTSTSYSSSAPTDLFELVDPSHGTSGSITELQSPKRESPGNII